MKSTMAPYLKSPSQTRTATPAKLPSIAGDRTEYCRCKSPRSLLNFAIGFLDAMRRRAPTTLFLILVFLSVFGLFSLYFTPNTISVHIITTRPAVWDLALHAVTTEPSRRSRHVNSIRDSSTVGSPSTDKRRWIKTDALLWPGWQVMVIVSPEEKLMPPRPGENYTCWYPNGETPQARFAAVLPFTNRTAFRCNLPGVYRHRHPIPKPVLLSSPKNDPPPAETTRRDLPLWNHIVFEAISTENDVVLLVKGLNRGLGSNRSPEIFRCVFGGDFENDTAKTAVTSSLQEVFRCPQPNITFDKPIKVSLETTTEPKEVVPSVAYYTPRHKLKEPQEKSLLCAATMVHNVAKFLREWVVYHSMIGIERFIIYDNESDDNINDVVKELNQDGYDVNTVLWLWPKTQEAGFSHAAVYANDSCTWMMYLDVDEFLFSPSWQKKSQPSDRMIRSLLPQSPAIGQVSFKSNEFGPSNQTAHPDGGVMQGYTCRRSEEQRHKSIVLLNAVEHSLYTAIHHFGLKEGYEWRVGSTEEAVVNHYKYQAWTEFKAKFRRRVSAYVVDWTRVSNPSSRDRTPGLGYKAVEPKAWAQRFCEVRDERLKKLTRKWFGYKTGHGYRMKWQR